MNLSRIKFFILLSISLVFLNQSFADVSFHRSGESIELGVSDIKNTLGSFIENDGDRDILFYVHGRSRTLEKELNRSIQIEKTHNLKVLMMHWDSWSSTISRPTEHAENAGDELRDAINQIKEFKEENAQIFKTKKLFILFHSMGNLIIKSYAENYLDDTLSSNIFDAAIFNAPDAPYRHHKDWISKVNLSPNQFILMNKHDAILNASKLLDINRDNVFDDRIGLGIKFYYHSNKILAQNVLYFDITRASGFGHAHFVSRNPEVFKIFKYIFSKKITENANNLFKATKNYDLPEIKLDPFYVVKNVYYFKD